MLHSFIHFHEHLHLIIQHIYPSQQSGDRSIIYATGGVLAITNRIVIVDLLTHVLDAKKVTGWIVMKGHMCQETRYVHDMLI